MPTLVSKGNNYGAHLQSQAVQAERDPEIRNFFAALLQGIELTT